MNNINFSHEHDFFLETYFMYDSDQRKYRYRLKTHNFSIYEARILEGQVLFEKNKALKAIELLNSFTASSKLLEGMRMFLLGISFSKAGLHVKGISIIESGFHLIKDFQNKKLNLMFHSVLIVNYGNQYLLDKMKQHLDLLSQYVHDSKEDLFVYRLRKLQYLVLAEKSDEGLKLLGEILADEKAGFLDQAPNLIILNLMLVFQKDDYKKCYDLLAKYKVIRSCKITTNYIFVKTLLDHLCHDGPLYVYNKDYQESVTMLKQAKIIKHLSIGEESEALDIWNELQVDYPHIYSADFEYKGFKGIFSECLKKHLNNVGANDLNLTELNSLVKIEDKLVYIFENSTRPIAKDEIVELIWGELIDEVNSLRLNKHLSRLRKKYDLNIKNSQGAYWLEKKPA